MVLPVIPFVLLDFFLLWIECIFVSLAEESLRNQVALPWKKPT
jgi:hypothetical protein